MSDTQKQALTAQALGLLDEQVQARIVHYKSELETSPELDAITAQVVAQLKALQSATAEAPEAEKAPEQIEEGQGAALHGLLGRVFSERSQYPTRILKPVGKRIAKLFFKSELHFRSEGSPDKVVRMAEQGVYYALHRYKNRLRVDLEAFEYASPELRASTLELLAKMERDLQVAFLSRRSSELNRVMTIFTSVVTDFLRVHVPTRLEQMAKLTIRAAETGRQPNSLSYKVLADSFPAFRKEWERVFMQQMVLFCGDALIQRLTQGDQEFQAETIQFFSDPHVFSETCAVMCEELYDFLCQEGFLDLPVDWRVRLSNRGDGN